MEEQLLVTKKGKKRSVNWTPAEKIALSNAIEQHVSIIEDKKQDKDAKRKKDVAWGKTLEEFRRGSKNYNFDLEQLKGQWKRMKTDAKKEEGNVRRSHQQTGGGAPPPPLSSDTATVIRMIPGDFRQPRRNTFDSDRYKSILIAFNSKIFSKS